jgi:hypothetical protein
MKVEAAEPRLSATPGRSRRSRRRVSQTKDRCPGASSHGDPLADGRRVERVQRRCLGFVEALGGLLAQQASAHQQPQYSRSNDTKQRFDFLVGGRFASHE